MKNLLPFLLFLILIISSCTMPSDKSNSTEMNQSKAPKFRTTGTIERLDPAIDALIPKDAKIEVLAEGFTWSEGPLWIESGQYLLFSDIPPNRVMKWSEKDGLSLYLKPSGYTGTKERGGEVGANALILNPEGALVLCQHGDRRMAKMKASLNSPQAVYETIIEEYDGKRFNSPNDAIYDSQGNLYFTDPPYGLEKGMNDPEKEIDFQGLYRYSKEGKLTVISDKMTRPNGLALSPDEKTLYVANSDPNQAIWLAFALNEDSTVQSERLFYDATGIKEKGLPDGLKIDHKGNIWATGPGGVWVFNPSGKVLGKIKTGEATSNCTFDTAQKTLYMTCDDYIMRLKL